MTYRPKLVTEKVKDALDWLKIWNDGRSDDMPKPEFFLDGYPVIPKTYELASEIRKVNPHLKFCTVGGAVYWSNKNGDSVRLFSRMWVYMEGHDYVLGEIGYGDYRIRHHDGSVYKFMVASRKIENGKVNSGYEQAHMALTESLKNAVKNACKYLVPHTLDEVARFSFDGFGRDIRSRRGEVINTARDVVDKCRNWNTLHTELKNLIRLGVQFVTPEFKEASENMLAAEKEAEEVRALKIGAYYVQFKEYVGVMRANILTFNHNYNDECYMGDAYKSEQIPASELPPEIQAKIAMLSMVDDMTSIPGIGMKASATSFWVEREL